MNEIWKDVVGYEGFYQASSLGRIKSMARPINYISLGKTKTSNLKTKILRCTKNNQSHYWSVRLCIDGIKKRKYVHSIVTEAFLGPCPAGHQCAHLNGDNQDNRSNNLAWVTPKENQFHRTLHGTGMAGDLHWNSRLSERDIPSIRRRYANGESLKNLAEYFGSTTKAIWAAANRRTWRCVPLDKS